MKKLLLISVILLISIQLFADVRLPRIFSDHMVLQRNKPITVWGWADAGESVTVQFNKDRKRVKAGSGGEWKVVLSAVEAGGPFSLTVKGKNTITLQDIWTGDVWICSGQSNMEWTVDDSNDAAQERQNGKHPLIRHFKVPRVVAAQPQADVPDGVWKVCSPETVGEFTAVGYYFARELTRELNIPIGLINTSWGGTHSETWTSREAFLDTEEFKAMISTMPVLNLDSLAQQNYRAAKARIQKLQGEFPVTASANHSWRGEFDDRRWPVMVLPELWESQALGNVDGVVWFRKTITVSASDAGKPAQLELAMIDDSDDTYVNGIRVGGLKGKYNVKRIYSVPENVLREGANVIAVRVEDTGGGGGIYGPPEAMKLTIGQTVLPLHGNWQYQVESLLNASSVGPNSYPTLLFNSMIHPLLNVSITGVIWYQGEANAWRAFQYRRAFPLMIMDWRKRWGQGDFPFYFVQLASFNSANGNSAKGSTWAELREAQALTLEVPNTGMAVTTDIGDPDDIHPRNKQDVGRRLAALALNRTYGKVRVDSGPTYQSMQVKGDRVRIRFTNTGSGLMVKDKYGYLKGFEVAGTDGKFHYAQASIEGDEVIVHHPSVTAPVAVRFGWADDASDNNLFNREGFPAVPFRTDSWRGITEENKFAIER
jgi:sialate O-acetylesterase